MNKTRFLVPFLYIGALFTPVHSQTVEEDSAETVVVAAIKSVRGLEIESYHRFLREATLIVSTTCNHKPWMEVERALDQQLCPLIASRQIDNPPDVTGKTLDRQYLAQENAVKLPNEQSLNAYIAISVRYDDGLGRDRSPGNTFHARVLLVDQLHAKTTDVKEDRYPKDTVLDLILKSDEIKREMKRWPYIKTIYLGYEPIVTRHGVYYGFDATVEFAESLDSANEGKRLYFTVPSGLGPAYGVIPDGFDQQDSLGNIQAYGSNEWGRKTLQSELDKK